MNENTITGSISFNMEPQKPRIYSEAFLYRHPLPALSFERRKGDLF